MSQILVLIYQGLYNHSLIIRSSSDWIHINETSIVSVFNIISQVCVASVEKKNHRKKVTIIFFHIYYTRESPSVYNYFCFVFDVFFVFVFICLCVSSDWIHINETSIECGSQSRSWINIKTKTKQKKHTQTNKNKNKKNVKNNDYRDLDIWEPKFDSLIFTHPTLSN
jgi:hypothetical protein